MAYITAPTTPAAKRVSFMRLEPELLTLLERLASISRTSALEVAVSDSECGIWAQQQAQIFHPFFTTKKQGTGLGLASARAIIEAHGGNIGFESQPHRGTRFWFRLPAFNQA